MHITSRPQEVRTRNTLTELEQKLVASTIDKIANELKLWLNPHEKFTIKHTARDDLIKFHHSLGRDIRNEYELWSEDHHVTQIWLRAEKEFPLSEEDGQTELIVKGVRIVSSSSIAVDDHPCHPDSISNRVIERLWEILQ
jgi:hypothetical protein